MNETLSYLCICIFVLTIIYAELYFFTQPAKGISIELSRAREYNQQAASYSQAVKSRISKTCTRLLTVQGDLRELGRKMQA